MQKNTESKLKLYIELFKAFFKIGLFTFGGGLAMLPLIQADVCDKHGWLKEEDMLDCFAAAQSLPGPIAINAATYVGSGTAGFLGAFFAVLGTILPSYTIIILVVLLLNQFEGNVYVDGALSGIKAGSCGLIAFAAFKNGKKILKNAFAWVVTIAAFIAIGIFNVNALWVIVLSGLAGIAYQAVKGNKNIQNVQSKQNERKGQGNPDSQNVQSK